MAKEVYQAASLGAAQRFKNIDKILKNEDKWLEKMNIDMCIKDIINSDYYAQLSEYEKASKFMMFGFGLMKIFDSSSDDVRCLGSKLPPDCLKGVIIADKIEKFCNCDNEKDITE